MEVLLVEDSPEVSLITVEYLNELGHGALAVADAETAVTQLGLRSFDALITDVSLPGMSGIDLAKEVCRSYPRLPVIICSGYGSLSLGALLGHTHPNVMLLPKPYDMTMLEKTLGDAARLALT